MNEGRLEEKRGGFPPEARGLAERVLPSNTGPHRLPRQIVTLAFLSGRLSASLMSERLARSLHAETGASVVLVRFEPLHGDGATEDGMKPDLSLNGEFHMPSAIQTVEGGIYSLVLGVGKDPPSAPGIASMVTQLSRHFRHVLIAAQTNERSAPWLTECILRSDLAYLFFPATPDSVQNYQEIMRHMTERRGGGKSQVKLVGCLAEGEPTGAFELLVQEAAAPMHTLVRGCPIVSGAGPATQPGDPPALFKADIRRLGREIGGRLVGLALSCGAAKGYAHIGVIQVLEENGIEVDVVAGSSMGSYIGAIWAYGMNGTEMEKLARAMEGRWSLLSLIDPAFPPRQGLLRGFGVRKRLTRTIGQARFADLPRPIRIVAGNLATLERVVFSSGEVAAAVHASSAVPGICVPVTIDGETYIDGGVVDPLPVDVLREMGVDRVIAVNVIPTPDRIRTGLRGGKEPRRHRRSIMRKLFRTFLPANEERNYFARRNLFEILLRSIYGAQIRIAEASCMMADVVLRPAISDDRWVDCCKPGRFIALGRAAAEKNLEEIKALVARREETYEQDLAPQATANVA